jgi:hypothetical protein
MTSYHFEELVYFRKMVFGISEHAFQKMLLGISESAFEGIAKQLYC